MFDGLSADYKRRLWLVIAINAAMFAVEMGAGALAGSQALQGRRARLRRRRHYLRNQSLPLSAPRCGPLNGRDRQGRQSDADGFVGAWRDCVSNSGRPCRARTSWASSAF